MYNVGIGAVLTEQSRYGRQNTRLTEWLILLSCASMHSNHWQFIEVEKYAPEV